MKIYYIRKVFPHDISHEVSVTKEIVKDFFDNQTSVEFIGEKSGARGTVKINDVTDPRFGGDFKTILKQEGDIEVNSLIVILKKSSDSYSVEIISKNDNRFESFNSFFKNNERHSIIAVDNDSDIPSRYHDLNNHNLYGMHITEANDCLDKNNAHVCIGWSIMGDLTTISNEEELFNRYTDAHSETSVSQEGVLRAFPLRLNAKRSADLPQIKLFRFTASVGDYVVYFKGGPERTANIGIIKSDYYYLKPDERKQNKDYVNNRKVDWIKSIPYNDLPEDLHKTSQTQRSIWDMGKYKESIDKLLNGTALTNDAGSIEKNKAVHSLNTILYGPPGTGKTYSTAEYAVAIIENISVDSLRNTICDRKALIEKYKKYVNEGRIVFTTFHQSYGYEDFIQGVTISFKENNVPEFKKTDGVFKKIADIAGKSENGNYVIIIDEINRANISKVFGELITLIEDDKRKGKVNELKIKLPSGDDFTVPDNLYIVGTMNSADKSISLIDVALRRRFDFIEIEPNAELIGNETLRNVFTNLNSSLLKQRNADMLIGHAYFMGKNESDLCEIMNQKIIPLLYEYFDDDKKKVKALIQEAINKPSLEIEIDDNDYGRLKLINSSNKAASLNDN